MAAGNKPIIEHGWMRALLMLFTCLLVGTGWAYLRQLLFPRADVDSLQGFLFSYSIAAAILILLTLLFRLRIDKASIGSMGLRPAPGKAMATGALFGILLLGTGTIMLLLLQQLFFAGAQLQPLNMATALLLFTIVAFAEEFIFRGYILHNLLQSFSAPIALGLSALAFTIVHGGNPSMTILSMLNIFTAGLLLGVNYCFSRNIWFAVALHFSWNFMQGPVLGFPVSGFEGEGWLLQTTRGEDWVTGGAFGFEGSIVCLLINITATALLWQYYSKSPVALAK